MRSVGDHNQEEKVMGLLKSLEGGGKAGIGAVFIGILCMRCIHSRYSKNAHHSPITFK